MFSYRINFKNEFHSNWWFLKSKPITKCNFQSIENRFKFKFIQHIQFKAPWGFNIANFHECFVTKPRSAAYYKSRNVFYCPKFIKRNRLPSQIHISDATYLPVGLTTVRFPSAIRTLRGIHADYANRHCRLYIYIYIYIQRCVCSGIPCRRVA